MLLDRPEHQRRRLMTLRMREAVGNLFAGPNALEEPARIHLQPFKTPEPCRTRKFFTEDFYLRLVEEVARLKFDILLASDDAHPIEHTGP